MMKTFPYRKIRFPENENEYIKIYRGWADTNNGRYFMSGKILDKEKIWHTFFSDDTAMIMEIDGMKLQNVYFGKQFQDIFIDIKIENINGHIVK